MGMRETESGQMPVKLKWFYGVEDNKASKATQERKGKK